jgi:hypothetical protein
MNNGVSLNNIHHPEGNGVEPDGVNPESLETIEIEIPMTNEQASDWAYKMICCLGISTSNSDINAVGLHKTVKELYEQGRADEREAQVCCGDYEKCWKACTPRGRWLAEKELAKPEQAKYSDIVSDGGLDPRNKFDAQPEQEPVAWMVRDQVDGCRYPSALKNPAGSINGESQPLYTAPPRKPWVGLTGVEINHIFAANVGYPERMCRAIEEALRSKNT